MVTKSLNMTFFFCAYTGEIEDSQIQWDKLMDDRLLRRTVLLVSDKECLHPWW
jgi:hypothetical protein